MDIADVHAARRITTCPPSSSPRLCKWRLWNFTVCSFICCATRYADLFFVHTCALILRHMLALPFRPSVHDICLSPSPFVAMQPSSPWPDLWHADKGAGWGMYSRGIVKWAHVRMWGGSAREHKKSTREREGAWESTSRCSKFVAIKCAFFPKMHYNKTGMTPYTCNSCNRYIGCGKMTAKWKQTKGH